MNVLVLLGVVAALVALRFVPRMNILAWLAAWWVALYVAFRFGIDPPLPQSIIGMFMGIVTLALLAYMSADSERFRFVRDRIVRFLTDRRYSVALIIVVVLLPVLVAGRVYLDVTATPSPPGFGRTIHPSPPGTITFQGRTVDLIREENPYRILETEDPDRFREHVENGRRVYYEHCFYCHGDDLAGDGPFAHALDPIPANLRSATTIAMLQESYLFWRIAKGGPGLPPESAPWSSAMPAWELFLTEDEIWDVILFMFDYTGLRPRARDHVD